MRLPSKIAGLCLAAALTAAACGESAEESRKPGRGGSGSSGSAQPDPSSGGTTAGDPATDDGATDDGVGDSTGGDSTGTDGSSEPPSPVDLAEGPGVEVDPRRAVVTEMTSYGKIYGWAVDKQDIYRQVTVELVLDKPKDQGGIVAVSTKANKVLADGGHRGYHGFFVDMPVAYRDGRTRPLYLYADDVSLLDEPASYRAFSPTEAGRTFFAANVAPKMTNCLECHTATYENFYPAFLGTGPNEGGTATANALIDKPLTQNGTRHAGGRRCASLDASPCKEFVAWWRVEFESN